MRAMRDPDAFLPSDLGVRHALEQLGHDGRPAAAEQAGRALAPLPRVRIAAPVGIASARQSEQSAAKTSNSEQSSDTTSSTETRLRATPRRLAA